MVPSLGIDTCGSRLGSFNTLMRKWKCVYKSVKDTVIAEALKCVILVFAMTKSVLFNLFSSFA